MNAIASKEWEIKHRENAKLNMHEYYPNVNFKSPHASGKIHFRDNKRIKMSVLEL